MITFNPMTDLHIGTVHMDATRTDLKVIKAQQGKSPKNLVFDVYHNGAPWRPADNGAHPLTHFVGRYAEDDGRWWDTSLDDKGNKSPTWEMDGSTVKLLLNDFLTREPGEFIISVIFQDNALNYLPQALCILQVEAAPFLPKPKMAVTLKLVTTETSIDYNGQTITAQAHLIDPETGEAVDKITVTPPCC